MSGPRSEIHRHVQLDLPALPAQRASRARDRRQADRANDTHATRRGDHQHIRARSAAAPAQILQRGASGERTLGIRAQIRDQRLLLKKD